MSDIATLFPNKGQFDTMNMMLGVIASNTRSIAINTFEDVRNIFRRGFGKAYFKRGDIMPVHRVSSVTINVGNSTGVTAATIASDTFLSAMDASYDNKVYEIIYDGAIWYNNENDEGINLATYGITVTGTPAVNDRLIITVTVDVLNFVFRHVEDYYAYIETDNCYVAYQFDAPEALYYCSSALPAGTYNITLDHGCYANSTVEDGTYQFTTTVNIPAGGQIRHTSIGAWRASGYGQNYVLGGTFATYASATATTPLEQNLATTIGSAGTSLGTFTARTPSYHSGDNTNYTDRQIYGSNNWGTSAIRQWLNADSSNWWTPAHNFDRPPTYVAAAGFMKGLDPEFLSIVVDTTNNTTSSVTDGSVNCSTTDKFFLPTLADTYMVAGTPWDYYKDFSDLASAGTDADTNRIKTYNGTTAYYWLRSPDPSHGGYVYRVSPSGALSNYGALNAFGVAPACKIGVDESDTTVAV